MKQASRVVVFMLVVVGVCFSPVQAERDDAGATTKRVDAKTKLMKATLKRETYGIESKDWGVAQTAEIFTKKPHAPTPRLHALANTVTTKALHELIIGDESPLLIDVMGGKGHRTVPGAIWLKGAGRSDEREERVDERLTAILEKVTEGDRMRAIVFFCLSAECWLSHNAALRAVALGYENVHWYRGGINAWKKAKLPTERARKIPW